MEHIIGNTKLRRELLEQIRDRINKGEGREDIFSDLGRKYIEQDSLAMLIARVPSPEDILSLTKKNSFLVVLIWTWAIVNLLNKISTFIPMIARDPKLMVVLPVAFLWPGVAVWVARKIRKIDGLFYRFVGLWGILAIGSTIVAMLDISPGNVFAWIDAVFMLSLSITISVLSFSIKREYFPHIGYYGVKAESGHFVLGRNTSHLRKVP